jgi:hypothetical protein
MVWARLTFGIQEFPRYRQPDRRTAGHDRAVQIYPPPDLRGDPLFFLGGDRGPPVPGHRRGRPSCDGVYGSANRGGREAAGYGVPGVQHVCAGDEARRSVCPIALIGSPTLIGSERQAAVRTHKAN